MSSDETQAVPWPWSVRMRVWLSKAFAGPRGPSPWVFGIFVAMHALLLYNAAGHFTYRAYDGGGHVNYFRALAAGHFPDPAAVNQFYAPPLPYLLPAALHALGMDEITAARIAQVSQAFGSAVMCVFLISICEFMRPRNQFMKAGVLALAALPTAYYRSFTYLRGEPWVAVALVVALWLILRSMRSGRVSWRSGMAWGVACGLALLSRQIAVFALVGMLTFAVLTAIRRPSLRFPLAKAVAVAILTAALVGGWFYGMQRMRYGSVAAYTLPARPFSFSNLPPSFYFGTGDGQLFVAPHQFLFGNQMLPELYSDWWGDHHGSFLFWGEYEVRDPTGSHPPRLGVMVKAPPWRTTNYPEMLTYLARVMRVSLLPSLLMLAAWGAGVAYSVESLRSGEVDVRRDGLALASWMLHFVLAGFLAYLICYVRLADANFLKATYLLPCLPLIALLGGDLLARLHVHSARAFAVVAVTLAAVAVHNAGTWVSSFIWY